LQWWISKLNDLSLEGLDMNIRIGHGFDAHRFIEGRKLMLGGVEIPYALGLEGHSDADAVIHAICDAILGAAGLGDIGEHFPDADMTWKNVDSRILLRHVVTLLKQNKYVVQNIDVTIVAQVPKLAPYREHMCEVLAQDLEVSLEQVNVKAKTTEGMGYVGRKEGIVAYAVVLIKK
jgi:2-C-methyl-D-erythritol 2,4-cyclodiphosphate synthase